MGQSGGRAWCDAHGSYPSNTVCPDCFPEPDLPEGIDYERFTPLVNPAPREAFADPLDLIEEEDYRS